MRSVRIFFEKKDTAVYISHLDLMRCFGRALRRAEIPFWYTEGYNPHPHLVFALPLSLGNTGLCEAVDIRLTEDMQFDEIVNRLNNALPAGIRAISAAEPVNKITELAWSEFLIEAETFDPSAAEKLFSLFGGEQITVKKKNKKKQIVDIDIKPMINKFSIAHDGGKLKIYVTLASGTNSNCSPSLVVDAAASELGMGPADFRVTHLSMLCSDMKAFK